MELLLVEAMGEQVVEVKVVEVVHQVPLQQIYLLDEQELLIQEVVVEEVEAIQEQNHGIQP